MSEPTAIRVALVDDHSMVRQALAAVLDAELDVEVVAQGGTCREAIELLDDNAADLLVLDYNLPDGGAIDVLEHLRAAPDPIPVLVLTVNESVHYALRTLAAGASGFMIKSSAVEELVEAIRTIRRGETYVAPQHRTKVLASSTAGRGAGIGSLSTREFEILRELAAGRSLKETAFKHDISLSTVSTYRSRIMKKLGLRSSSELIRFALENGVLE